MPMVHVLAFLATVWTGKVSHLLIACIIFAWVTLLAVSATVAYGARGTGAKKYW